MTRPDRAAMLAAVACLVVLAGAAVVWAWWPRPRAATFPWSSYETTPSGIVVQLEVSPCDTNGDAEVVETDDAVVVGVPGTVSDGDCVALAEIRRVRVPLTMPLGDREVYDARCVAEADGERADRCRREVSPAR